MRLGLHLQQIHSGAKMKKKKKKKKKKRRREKKGYEKYGEREER